jgi:signal transduction histidine kinase
MGLALSQRLAQAMNAALVVSNGPGEGTTVRLRLPNVARPAARPADRLLQNDAAPNAAT